MTDLNPEPVDWHPADGGETPPMFDADNPRRLYNTTLSRLIRLGRKRCGVPGPAGAPWSGCELTAGHEGHHSFLIEWR